MKIFEVVKDTAFGVLLGFGIALAARVFLNVGFFG